MKQNRALIILVFTVFLFFSLFPLRNSRLSDLMLTESEYKAIKNSRQRTEEPLLKDLLFDNRSLPKDHQWNTFYYSVNEIDPIVKSNGLPSSKIAFREETITPEWIESNKHLQMLVYSDRYFEEYEIVFTTAPIIDLYTDSKITNEYSPLRMIIHGDKESVPSGVLELTGFIHLRGNISREFPKENFRITLSGPYPLLGMRCDDDWVLKDNYLDHEKIRDAFSSILWERGPARDNRFGLDGGTEFRFAEVILNGEYIGLYELGNPINNGVLNLDPAAGEFAWKMERSSAIEEVYIGKEGLLYGMELVNPVSEEQQQAAKEAVYEHFCQINDPETPAAVFYDTIDLQNAIDFYLFMVLIQPLDQFKIIDGKVLVSNYFITAKNYEGKRTYLYFPWDMDRSWGYKTFTPESPYEISPDVDYPIFKTPVSRLLELDPEPTNKLISEKYQDLRQNEWSDEMIDEIIDELESDVFRSGAFRRNTIRWSETNAADPADKLTRFRSYVHARFAHLDTLYGY